MWSLVGEISEATSIWNAVDVDSSKRNLLALIDRFLNGMKRLPHVVTFQEPQPNEAVLDAVGGKVCDCLSRRSRRSMQHAAKKACGQTPSGWTR